MERALQRLTRALRGLAPSRSAAVGRRLAEGLFAALGQGRSFGTALGGALAPVVASSIEAALHQFDSGAVALFIVDLRDALARRFERAAAVAAERGAGGPWVQARLQAMAAAMRSETVEQHLINAVLSVSGLYAEGMTLDPRRLDREALAERLTSLLQRATTTVLSRAERSMTLGALPGDTGAAPLGSAPLANA